MGSPRTSSYFHPAPAVIRKREGCEQLSANLSGNPGRFKEHARLFFGHLKGGTAEVITSYPAGIIGTTAQNLLSAAEGEKFEGVHPIRAFAKIAEKEGFADAARTFRQLAKVQVYHERRHRKQPEDVEQNRCLPGNQ